MDYYKKQRSIFVYIIPAALVLLALFLVYKSGRRNAVAGLGEPVQTPESGHFARTLCSAFRALFSSRTSWATRRGAPSASSGDAFGVEQRRVAPAGEWSAVGLTASRASRAAPTSAARNTEADVRPRSRYRGHGAWCGADTAGGEGGLGWTRVDSGSRLREAEVLCRRPYRPPRPCRP